MSKTKSKFGFAKVETVTAAVLRSRIKHLEKCIADGKWNADKTFAAGKVAAYYRWQLTHDERFVGKKKGKAKKKTSARKAA